MAGCKSCAKQAGMIPKAVDPYTDDEKVEILGEAISTALRKAELAEITRRRGY